jgi:hypothetical protein
MLHPPPWAGVEPTTSVVIGTDCTGSCKSNYHTISWGLDFTNMCKTRAWRHHCFYWSTLTKSGKRVIMYTCVRGINYVISYICAFVELLHLKLCRYYHGMTTYQCLCNSKIKGTLLWEMVNHTSAAYILSYTNNKIIKTYISNLVRTYTSHVVTLYLL